MGADLRSELELELENKAFPPPKWCCKVVSQSCTQVRGLRLLSTEQIFLLLLNTAGLRWVVFAVQVCPELAAFCLLFNN